MTVLESCIPKHENTSTLMTSPGKKGENLSQWFRQKSGGDSTVSSEFVIAGMIFHHSWVKSERLHK
jgi:hypothetical protein